MESPKRRCWVSSSSSPPNSRLGFLRCLPPGRCEYKLELYDVNYGGDNIGNEWQYEIRVDNVQTVVFPRPVFFSGAPP